MSDQLAFNWPRRDALGAEDFFVTDANAAAHAMVMDADSWPDGKLAVIGPPGSGTGAKGASCRSREGQ